MFEARRTVRADGDAKPLVGQVTLSWSPGSCANGFTVSRWTGTKWAAVMVTRDPVAVIASPSGTRWLPYNFGVDCTP